MTVEILKPARLNGCDIEIGEVVDVESTIASAWMSVGIARIPEPKPKPVKEEKETKQKGK